MPIPVVQLQWQEVKSFPLVHLHAAEDALLHASKIIQIIRISGASFANWEDGICAEKETDA